LNKIDENISNQFYNKLDLILMGLFPDLQFKKNYMFKLTDSLSYFQIDYYVEGKHAPLYIFGIPNKDKARLTNIVLERLLRAKVNFDSLLIFADQTTMTRSDLARLSNTGGEMIASLDAVEDFSRKLLRKVGEN
jgi:hypothetical protein